MNTRNIERKRIEQISPTISTGDQIQGNELFMVSARDTNSTNGYSTKKMGIQALKDYVLGGNTGNNEIVISNGGYEMYDTSENTDGTYSSISEYENSSNNYAWYLEVPRGGTLTKTVTKDCVVWIDGVGVQDDYNPNYNWSFYINNVKIYTFLFRNNFGGRAIYVKRGQELKLETQTYPIKLSVIPLASGGQFFIDTSIAPERGTLTQNFTYEATRPTLFAHDSVPNVSETTSAKINGKNVVPMEHGGYSHMSTYYILKTGDILTTVTYSNAAANYAAYALLEDGNGSGGNSGSSSCGYEIYRMSESNVGDYIYEESVSGSWTKTFNEDCEILMTPEGTPLGELSDSLIVKLDGIRLHTGLLSLGVDDKAQFYVKAGQTLTVEAGPSWYSAKLSARPLKCGGDFFIDSRGELPESFTSHTRKDSTFTFTAPSKTLFIWATGTAVGVFSSVKLNNMDIDWKTQGTSIRYDRMVLDTGDTLTLTFGGGLYVKYCAYPLMDYSSSESEPESVQLWENGPYWATRNLGSEKPEDFGMYFPFGSTKGYYLENGRYTDGKTEFDYKFSQSSEDRGTDWIEQGILEQVNENDVHVSPIHDAARTILGEEWSIPLQSDFQGLIDNCDWEEFTINGVKGHKYTGRGGFSDKSIFLPIAGYANYPSAPSSNGYYMSASVDSRYIDAADVYARFMIYSMSGHKSNFPAENTSNNITQANGLYGLPIRPIKVVS